MSEDEAFEYAPELEGEILELLSRHVHPRIAWLLLRKIKAAAEGDKTSPHGMTQKFDAP
jgi:hypothetical protein